MRIPLWPQSLFGRLIAALVIAVVVAQAASLYLYAIHLERFVLDSSVREWSRRITEVTLLLEQLPPGQRGPTVARLKEQSARLAHHRERREMKLHLHVWHGSPALFPPPPPPPPRQPRSPRARPPSP